MPLFGRQKNKKEVVQAPVAEEVAAPIDATALPLNQRVNYKSTRAQDLYDNWMDEQRRSKSKGETPEVFPTLQQRSKFALANDYMLSQSPSLHSAKGEVEPKKKSPIPTVESWGSVDKPKSRIVKRTPVPRSMPSAKPPLHDLTKWEEEAERAEFLAWVTNGREDDNRPEVIHRILFRKRGP